MRLLLDECVDSRLAREIHGHDVKTVYDMGWDGIKNGRLLSLAQDRFDVLLTTDRNLSFQQNLRKFQIAVMILQAKTNRLIDLRPLIPAILTRLNDCRSGAEITVGD